MKKQKWIVGDTEEACIPLGNQTAKDHGLPEGIKVVYAASAGEALRISDKEYGEKIKTKDLILRRIPEDVHRAFKVKCAKEGVGMTEKIIEHMKKEAAEGL